MLCGSRRRRPSRRWRSDAARARRGAAPRGSPPRSRRCSSRISPAAPGSTDRAVRAPHRRRSAARAGIARPIVALARAPGPKQSYRAFSPSVSRTGPFTTSSGAQGWVVLWIDARLKAGSSSARTAASTTGKYSGRQPPSPRSRRVIRPSRRRDGAARSPARRLPPAATHRGSAPPAPASAARRAIRPPSRGRAPHAGTHRDPPAGRAAPRDSSRAHRLDRARGVGADVSRGEAHVRRTREAFRITGPRGPRADRRVRRAPRRRSSRPFGARQPLDCQRSDGAARRSAAPACRQRRTPRVRAARTRRCRRGTSGRHATRARPCRGDSTTCTSLNRRRR